MRRVELQIEDILEDYIDFNHIPKKGAILLQMTSYFSMWPVCTKHAKRDTIDRIFALMEDENRQMHPKEIEELSIECGCTYITLGLN